MTKEEIVSYLAKNKNRFLNKYHITKIGLFGSYAKGNANKNSDIDIAYELEEDYKINYSVFLSLNDELERDLRTKIDLVNLKKMNPLILITARDEFIYV